jgi:hypothetical protein
MQKKIFPQDLLKGKLPRLMKAEWKKTDAPMYWYGITLPAGIEVKVFEGADFGYVVLRDKSLHHNFIYKY